MKYNKKVDSINCKDEIIEKAKSFLIANNFSITSSQENFISAENKYYPFGKNQNPILFANKIEITVGDFGLEVTARLDYVKKMMLYTGIFVASLFIFFLILFSITFHGKNQPWLLVAILPLAPWIILIPLFGKFWKNRTNKALDVLVQNLCN